MKSIVILCALFIMSCAGSPVMNTIDDSGASHDLVFCPVCKEEGLKSKVYIGTCMSTLLYCGSGHYDEEGRFHPPEECNTVSCTHTCSNGHSF